MRASGWPGERACSPRFGSIGGCAHPPTGGVTGGLAPAGRLDDGRPLAQRLPPGAVRLVPPDGLREPVLEVDLVAPAQLFAELCRVEQVAAIVARAVRHDRLQRLRFLRQLEDRVGDLLDRLLDTRPDVVRLSLAPALQHELDRAAMVEDVEPLAPVLRR